MYTHTYISEEGVTEWHILLLGALGKGVQVKHFSVCLSVCLCVCRGVPGWVASDPPWATRPGRPTLGDPPWARSGGTPPNSDKNEKRDFPNYRVSEKYSGDFGEEYQT